MAVLFEQTPIAVPANFDQSFTWTPPAGTTVVKLIWDIPTTPLSNYEDTTHTIIITVARASDNFVIAGATWQGGRQIQHINKPVDPPPEMNFDLTQHAQVPLKVRLQVPIAMTAGVTVTG